MDGLLMSMRELGNPAGNPLAQPRNATVNAAPRNPVIVDFAGTSSQSGVYRVPDWAEYYRVTAVGAGGVQTLVGIGKPSGGGGGLAQSELIPVNKRTIDITYSVPGTTAVQTASGSATASSVDFSLQATGGGNGSGVTPGAGGVGSGGAINNTGGTGGYGGNFPGGGGAAGITSNGGNGGGSGAGSAPSGNGGAGGTNGGTYCGGGGGGVWASGALGGNGADVASANGPWGAPGSNNASGGGWGGGGAGMSAGNGVGSGGYGGVRIELW
jgi:hypothetical protein